MAILGVVGFAAALLAACGSSVGGGAGSPSGSGVTSASAAPSGPFPDGLSTKLDALGQQFKHITRTPGLLIEVHSPKGTYERALGVADLSKNRPLTTQMQYRLGSQTKVFVAEIALILAGERKLSLDDRVSKWVNGVPNGDTITIRQLLNHTGGLADVFASPQIQQLLPTGCTPQQLLAEGNRLAPVFAPGASWAYSNFGYDLVGVIDEMAGGDTLANLVKSLITDPLRLTRTYLPTTGNGLTDPYTHGYYVPDGSGRVPTVGDDATQLPASCLWAAGGMVSTLSDMAVWTKAMGNGSLLTPEMYQEQVADPVLVPVDLSLGHGPVEWGLGPIIVGSFIGHQGGVPGYETASYYSPLYDTTIVIATNLQFNKIPPNQFMQAVAETVLGSDIGLPLTVQQAMTPLTASEMHQITSGQGKEPTQ